MYLYIHFILVPGQLALLRGAGPAGGLLRRPDLPQTRATGVHRGQTGTVWDSKFTLKHCMLTLCIYHSLTALYFVVYYAHVYIHHIMTGCLVHWSHTKHMVHITQ